MAREKSEVTTSIGRGLSIQDPEQDKGLGRTGRYPHRAASVNGLWKRQGPRGIPVGPGVLSKKILRVPLPKGPLDAAQHANQKKRCKRRLSKRNKALYYHE